MLKFASEEASLYFLNLYGNSPYIIIVYYLFYISPRIFFDAKLAGILIYSVLHLKRV